MDINSSRGAKISAIARPACSKGAGNAPLVSCIMPTSNRRAFVASSLRRFLRQDYPNKELVVVDDGNDPVRDLMPDNPGVRYAYINRKLTLGLKRNLAVNAARGEYIVHWDDDDWYAPSRVSAQVSILASGQADVVALNMRHVLDLETMEFWMCPPELHSRLHFRDLCCGTISYRKSLWASWSKYGPTNLAEDVHFLRSLPESTRICKLPDDNLFLCVRHQFNTWRISPDWRTEPGRWLKVPTPLFLDQEDYQDLMRLSHHCRDLPVCV